MSVLVRGRVSRGRLLVDAPLDLPDDTEVELMVLVEEQDSLDAADRAQLHEALRASRAELERGDVVPVEDVLAGL